MHQHGGFSPHQARKTHQAEESHRWWHSPTPQVCHHEWLARREASHTTASIMKCLSRTDWFSRESRSSYHSPCILKWRLRSTHLIPGLTAALKRARESLFWPGMTIDIKHFISTCETCCTYQSANQQEMLQSHELPSCQWETVGVDLFELDSKDYMITVDYFSNFWEIDRLKSTKSSTVIIKLKAHFTRYGSPCVVVSDNGPQFTSANFENFSHNFDF